jgi:hypothetical protein
MRKHLLGLFRIFDEDNRWAINSTIFYRKYPILLIVPYSIESTLFYSSRPNIRCCILSHTPYTHHAHTMRTPYTHHAHTPMRYMRPYYTHTHTLYSNTILFHYTHTLYSSHYILITPSAAALSISMSSAGS